MQEHVFIIVIKL